MGAGGNLYGKPANFDSLSEEEQQAWYKKDEERKERAAQYQREQNAKDAKNKKIFIVVGIIVIAIFIGLIVGCFNMINK